MNAPNQHVWHSPAIRPVFPQPFDRSVEARDSNVPTITQGCEFFTISEDAIRNRLIAGHPGCGFVCVNECDEIVCVQHVGIFTAQSDARQRYYNRMNPSAIAGKTTAMAKLKDILDRIDQSRPIIDGKPMADQQISALATGKEKSDLIRNWRRSVRDGKAASARLDSVDSVAHVLGVSAEWLRDGVGERDAPPSEIEAELLNMLRTLPPEIRPSAAKAALATVQAVKGATPEKI